MNGARELLEWSRLGGMPRGAAIHPLTDGPGTVTARIWPPIGLEAAQPDRLPSWQTSRGTLTMAAPPPSPPPMNRAQSDFARVYSEHVWPIYGFLAYRRGTATWPRT